MRHQCVSCESLVLVHVDSWSYCFKCVCVYFLDFCPNSVYLEGFLFNILIPRQITPSTLVPPAPAQRFPQPPKPKFPKRKLPNERSGVKDPKRKKLSPSSQAKIPKTKFLS